MCMYTQMHAHTFLPLEENKKFNRGGQSFEGSILRGGACRRFPERLVDLPYTV